MKSRSLKFVFVFFLSIAMLMSISACSAQSDSDTGSDAAATDAVATDAAATDAAATDAAATDAVATDAPAASGDVVAAYVFTNTGTAEICELYLSPATTDNWGPDQLKSQTIAAGATFTLTNVPAGKYDAKVVGCNGAGESSIVLDIHN